MGRVSALPQATADRLMELRGELTLAATAARLDAEGFTTATGRTWSANSVAKAQKRLVASAASLQT